MTPLACISTPTCRERQIGPQSLTFLLSPKISARDFPHPYRHLHRTVSGTGCLPGFWNHNMFVPGLPESLGIFPIYRRLWRLNGLVSPMVRSTSGAMPSMQYDAGDDGEAQGHDGSDDANPAQERGALLDEQSNRESQEAERQID